MNIELYREELSSTKISRATAKKMERHFGGVVNARKLLKLEITNFNKGITRSNKCIAINEIGLQKEKEIYKLLCDKFGEIAVHKEYPPLEDSRIRVDFYIHCKNENFFVDVFYPSSMQSMGGCLNNKIKKYRGDIMNQFPVIFLMMNDLIPKERIEKFLGDKKNPFLENQKMMSIDEFKEFIENKIPFEVR